jgi:uncharacterized protein YqjF (DUF2071 family)
VGGDLAVRAGAASHARRSGHPIGQGLPRVERAHYRPSGAVRRAPVGSLDAWLTERYCLYTVDARGTVYRAEIHHPPWPLQPAEADIAVNTMAAASGLTLSPRDPLLHFAEHLDVHVWLPERVAEAG